VTLTKLLNYLPRGHLLDDATWRKRHLFLLFVLSLHLPVILGLGLLLHHSLPVVLAALAPVLLFLVIGASVRHQRTASFFVTAGLVYTAAAFTVLSRGAIEAHFHFFVIIGLIALYQDWVPFMWNIVFTVLSHAIGSAWQAGLIFNHLPAQNNPWLWSLLHASAVLAACIGVVVFWGEIEHQQQRTLALTTRLADAEIRQRKFTSELLVNLARRNQSMLYRQLDIINQLEEKERDPDALGELFRLDHLATRIRRNAESLLVLSGEEPTRVWSEPVRLIDVVRAAIAETEDLDRVAFAVDERVQVLGHTVTDLTHVLAELTENAVRFSPPEANVTIRTRPYLRMPGAAVLTVEDWGVGMRPEAMVAANDLLAHPREVDLAVSQRLGLHVVTRLAARHNIQASLTPTPGTGVTAVVVLPAELFATNPQKPGPEKPVAPPPDLPVPDLPAPDRPVPDRPVPEIPVPRRTVTNPRLNGHRTRGLHARPDQEDPPDWAGWWTPARPVTGQPEQPPPVYATAEPLISETTPAAPPMLAPAAALPAAPPRPAPRALLTRRVPQAHLVPELRRSEPARGSAAEPSALPDAEQARAALSRFQASRQAAQHQVTGAERGAPTRNGHRS
jgi:signal transduction histidine kinase